MKREEKQQVLLCVEETGTDIILFSDTVELDRVRVEPSRELLEKLLPAIDTLLEQHHLVPSDISDIRVESDLPDGYSSRRIAETVANTWKLVEEG